jgi:hypothetical protein
MGTGFVLLKSETVVPEEVVRLAPVMLNWKKRTVTPAGGVSVTVRPTGTFVVTGLLTSGVVPDWLPQPAINNENATMSRDNAFLRISSLLG